LLPDPQIVFLCSFIVSETVPAYYLLQ